MLGAFIRDLEARVAEVEAERRRPARPTELNGHDTAGELRDALRLGRLLLAGTEVTL